MEEWSPRPKERAEAFKKTFKRDNVYIHVVLTVKLCGHSSRDGSVTPNEHWKCCPGATDGSQSAMTG